MRVTVLTFLSTFLYIFLNVYFYIYIPSTSLWHE